jgi:hypothetical protein
VILAPGPSGARRCPHRFQSRPHVRWNGDKQGGQRTLLGLIKAPHSELDRFTAPRPDPPRRPVAVPKAPRGRTSGRRPRLQVALLRLLNVGVGDQVGEEVRTVSWTRPYGTAPRSSPILPRLLDRARCGGRVRAGAYVGRRAATYPGRGGILCPANIWYEGCGSSWVNRRPSRQAFAAMFTPPPRWRTR